METHGDQLGTEKSRVNMGLMLAWLCFPLEEASKAELAALSLVGLGYRRSPQVSGI